MCCSDHSSFRNESAALSVDVTRKRFKDSKIIIPSSYQDTEPLETERKIERNEGNVQIIDVLVQVRSERDRLQLRVEELEQTLHSFERREREFWDSVTASLSAAFPCLEGKNEMGVIPLTLEGELERIDTFVNESIYKVKSYLGNYTQIPHIFQVKITQFLKELKALVKKLKEENLELKIPAAEQVRVKKDLEKLQNSVQGLVADKSKLMEAVRILDEEKEELKKRNEEIEERSSELIKTEIEKHRQENAEKEAEITRLQTLVSVLRPAVVASEVDFPSSNSSIVSETTCEHFLKRLLSQKDDLIYHLESELKTFQATNESLRESIKRLISEIRSSEQLQSTALKNVSELRLLVKSLREQLATTDVAISSPLIQVTEISPHYIGSHSFEAGVSQGLQYLISLTRGMNPHNGDVPEGIYAKEMLLANELSALESLFWRYQEREEYLETELLRLKQGNRDWEIDQDSREKKSWEVISPSEHPTNVLENEVREVSLKLDLLEELQSVQINLAEREADCVALKQHLASTEAEITFSVLSIQSSVSPPSTTLQDILQQGFLYISQVLVELTAEDCSMTLNLCENQYRIYQKLLVLKDRFTRLRESELIFKSEKARLNSDRQQKAVTARNRDNS